MSNGKQLVRARPDGVTAKSVETALAKVFSGGGVETPNTLLANKDRLVRRGKFFLSHEDMDRHSSLAHPIFGRYCHNVIVGQTELAEDKAGIWVFAAHPNFELIPEFMDPHQWPEYERTEAGWKMIVPPTQKPQFTQLDEFLARNKQLRLT